MADTATSTDSTSSPTATSDSSDDSSTSDSSITKSVVLTIGFSIVVWAILVLLCWKCFIRRQLGKNVISSRVNHFNSTETPASDNPVQIDGKSKSGQECAHQDSRIDELA